MRFARSAILVVTLSFAVSAHAQSGTSTGGLLQVSTGSLQYIPPSVPVAPATPVSSPVVPGDVTWIDAGKLADAFRIPEKVADLRAVATDPSGKNVGFYYVSGKSKTFAVYRNGRLMQDGSLENLGDMQKPVLFHMTASGDLVYALHGTDLYVNSVPVSLDTSNFGWATHAANERGGTLTYPEGGKVIAYDIARNRKTVLHRHDGTIEYVRREGATVAYVVRERGGSRMYRDGRRVSLKAVDNPANFALTPEGDVFFFTTSARGYALYRNARPYVTGRGNGAYVNVDPEGHVWHISYTRSGQSTSVRLQKDRAATNLLPADVANIELHLLFPGTSYAARAAFAKDPSSFFLIRNGKALGAGFPFEFPYNDTNGPIEWGGSVALRAYRNARWRAYVDGTEETHKTLKNVFFMRTDGDDLTVYATR